jgi:hypothetical protein
VPADAYVVFDEPPGDGDPGSTLAPADDDEDDDDPFVVIVEDSAGTNAPPPPSAPPPSRTPPSRPPIYVESMEDVYATFEAMEAEARAAEVEPIEAPGDPEPIEAPGDPDLIEAIEAAEDDDDEPYGEPELPEFPDITSGDGHPGTEDVEAVFESQAPDVFAADERDATMPDVAAPPPKVEPIDLGTLDDAPMTSPTLAAPFDDDDEGSTMRMKLDSPRVPPTPPPASRTMIVMEDDFEDEEEELATQRVQLAQPRAADPQATVLFQRPSTPLTRPDDDAEKDDDAIATKRLSVDSLRERLLARKRGQPRTPTPDRATPPPAPPKPPEDYDPNARTVILTPEQLRQMAMEEDDEDDEEDHDPPTNSSDKTTLFSKEDLAAEFDFVDDDD